MSADKLKNDKKIRPFGRIELDAPSGEKPKKAAVKKAALKKSVDKKGGDKRAQGKKSEQKKGDKKLRSSQEIWDGGDTVRVIPLGGIGEIGKNMTVFEYKDSAIILDCGLCFPDSELFGVDIVIPDFTYVASIKDKLKALFITHGHEDHIGAVPYFLKSGINIPIYGSNLSLGLIEAKLEEHQMRSVADLHVIAPGSKVSFGNISLEAINVNHSIPAALGYAITTPVGTIVHTGDFKIDYTPIFGDVINLRRFGELGGKGVLAMLADSTNAERPGISTSERVVGESFEALAGRVEGKRLIIATFASNIYRVQQIINLAERHGRKVALSGRSMLNYTNMAIKLGYLTIKEDTIIDIEEINKVRPENLIIITTGSQGEPLSALSRMAAGSHRQVTINSEDVIIISANPIPGNEKTVGKVINELVRKGSDVIYESMYDVHASGHACRDELKLMLSLINPQFFIPVHGEYKHLAKHVRIAKDLGMDSRNVILPETGRVIEISKNRIRATETVPSGRVLVDGLGVGDVGSVVLRDRKHLAEDGLIVVVCSIDTDTGELISGPDVISRGFVYMREAEELISGMRDYSRQLIEGRLHDNSRDWNDIKAGLREGLGQMIYKKTKRNPMILPIIMEI